MHLHNGILNLPVLVVVVQAPNWASHNTSLHIAEEIGINGRKALNPQEDSMICMGWLIHEDKQTGCRPYWYLQLQTTIFFISFGMQTVHCFFFFPSPSKPLWLATHAIAYKYSNHRVQHGRRTRVLLWLYNNMIWYIITYIIANITWLPFEMKLITSNLSL